VSRHSHPHPHDSSVVEFPAPPKRRRPEVERENSRNRVPMSISVTEAMKAKLKGEAARTNMSVSGIIAAALTQYFQLLVSRNAWETDDEEGASYSPKRFYTASDDKQGHSAQIRLYIPKGLAGQIARIVNSNEIPEYRSVQDFYRDALTHRAYQVGDWLDDDELVGEVHMLILMSEEYQLQQIKRDVESLCSIMEDNLNEAFLRDDLEWIKAYISDRRDKQTAVPELYRDRYLSVLDAASEKLDKQGGKRRRR
jgi:hypothetical protein